MKVLLVDNDPAVFDPASAVRARLRAYAAEIGELHVMTRAPEDAREEQEGGLSLHPIVAGKAAYLFMLIRRAHALIQEQGIEIVSAQDPFEHGLAALIATISTPAKLHLQIHTDILSPYFARDSWKNRARLIIAALTLRCASGIRVVSRRIKDSLAQKYGKGIAVPVVIPVVIPFEVPPPVPLPRHSFMFTLATASRLEPEKRVQNILAALVLVRRKYPDVGLFIMGEGSRKAALMREAKALGLGDNVTFLGFRSDAMSLMQSAQAYISASAYEGYGLTLLEAARAGVPIITTDVGIVGEVLVPGEGALVSPVGDVYALAANILRLIEKSELRETLAHTARIAATAHVEQYQNQPARIAADLAHALDRR